MEEVEGVEWDEGGNCGVRYAGGGSCDNCAEVKTGSVLGGRRVCWIMSSLTVYDPECCGVCERRTAPVAIDCCPFQVCHETASVSAPAYTPGIELKDCKRR